MCQASIDKEFYVRKRKMVGPTYNTRHTNQRVLGREEERCVFVLEYLWILSKNYTRLLTILYKQTTQI